MYSPEDLERARRGFDGFVKFGAWSLGAIIVSLVLMAIFLV